MSQTEGRIMLTLWAYRKGQFPSIRAAARLFDVPHATLARRYKGTPYRPEAVATNQKLSQTKETTLINWILDIDTRGMPPTQALICQIAEILLVEHVKDMSAPPPKIGKH